MPIMTPTMKKLHAVRASAETVAQFHGHLKNAHVIAYHRHLADGVSAWGY